MSSPAHNSSEKFTGEVGVQTPNLKNEGQVAQSTATSDHESVDDTLAPQDGGRGAWMFLFGASIVEISAWGFPYTYGVFRAYFFENPPFQGLAIVSIVGVLANGLLQLVLPPIMYFLNNYPSQRKNTMWLGNLICCLAPIGGGLSTTPVGLIMTLGVLYGVGSGLLFAPTIHLMHDWFSARKSLAYGVICGAGALAGAGLPPIYAVCLERFGYKATLIGWGLCSLFITTVGLLCIHPRVPPKIAPKPSRKDFDFFKKPLFSIMLTATVVQALAHYHPSIYLPSFGQDFGLSAAQGSLLATILNLAQAVGQPLQGHLADWRISFYSPMLVSTLGSVISVLCIWGFARNLWSLVLFSLAYGITAGGFAVLRPRFSAAVVGNDNNNEQSMLIFSILTASRGTAIIASGFISTGLVFEEEPIARTWGGGKRYRNVLIYVAVVMFAASWGALGKFVGPKARFGKKVRTAETQIEGEHA